MTKTSLTLVTLFFSGALVSFADESSPNKRLEQLFKNFDADGDGGISLAEYKAGMVGQMAPARVETVFKQKDRDKDGKLTLAELLYAPQDPAKPEKKDDKKPAKAK